MTRFESRRKHFLRLSRESLLGARAYRQWAEVRKDPGPTRGLAAFELTMAALYRREVTRTLQETP